jgi:2-amino-4-hydroxy-6-hydroxymethyldihydropteridine diphosphokinase
MDLIYLSLGTNLGRRELHLQEAVKLIQSRIGNPERVSRYYESEPWGFSSAHSFYNCCLSLKTTLAPLLLMDELLAIEKEMGRQREQMDEKRGERAYSDRIIDIDLLFYGDHQVVHPSLTLPHPSLEDRRFVLLPLAEIAPDLIHPVTGMSVKLMLQQCKDKRVVVPVQDLFKSSSSQNI